jgi:hypothetical protein
LNINTLTINNNNNTLTYIDEKQKNILNDIYLNLIKRIKFFIQNNRLIRDIGYEIFEKEWNNYQRDFSLTIENLISKPFLLMPYNLEDIIEGN